MNIRLLVAITPLLGAIIFPLVVPITITKFGLGSGLVIALLLTTAWFVAMLRTAEMPH
tara:strand:+ start:13828 stop:14001 length:174 start_codon:yes stop_codon:yes gene_type:complete